jgi:hypothetical protein
VRAQGFSDPGVSAAAGTSRWRAPCRTWRTRIPRRLSSVQAAPPTAPSQCSCDPSRTAGPPRQPRSWSTSRSPPGQAPSADRSACGSPAPSAPTRAPRPSPVRSGFLTPRPRARDRDGSATATVGTPRYVPSTAASVFHLLDTWLDTVGEDRADFYHRSLIVVVGRSNNVGEPAISLAYDRQAAVASIDEWASRTAGIGRHTRRTDVLVVAAGRPRTRTRRTHPRRRGPHRRRDQPPARPATGTVHMVGDVDFASTAPRARTITPVSGGVGPVTDVWVVRNTIRAARAVAARRGGTAP